MCFGIFLRPRADQAEKYEKFPVPDPNVVQKLC